MSHHVPDHFPLFSDCNQRELAILEVTSGQVFLDVLLAVRVVIEQKFNEFFFRVVNCLECELSQKLAID